MGAITARGTLQDTQALHMISELTGGLPPVVPSFQCVFGTRLPYHQGAQAT
jgi:hypothetical protein